MECASDGATRDKEGAIVHSALAHGQRLVLGMLTIISQLWSMNAGQIAGVPPRGVTAALGHSEATCSRLQPGGLSTSWGQSWDEERRENVGDA